MQIRLGKQGTPQWWLDRKGIPSASEFGNILTAKTLKPSASQEPYICQLIADTYTENPPEDLGKTMTRPMQNGVDMEPEARRWLAMRLDKDITEVGFCVTDCGRFGCSPDGLLGDESGIELKCPTGKVHVGYLLAGGLPDDYKAQVHGALIVTGRPHWYFCSYHPTLPKLLVKVVPNTFTKALRDALDEFHVKYQAKLNEMKLIDGIEI